MKQIPKFAAASLLLASYSGFAATPADGWYAGLLGGVSYTPTVSVRAPNPHPFLFLQATNNPVIGNNRIGLPPRILPNFLFPGFFAHPFLPGRLTHGPGGDFAGQLGYRICNFRLEAELLFNFIPLSHLKIAGTTIGRHVTGINPIRLSGQNNFGTAFANAYYDFYDEENDPTWVPYIGLGVGYSYIRDTFTLTVPFLFARRFSYTARGSKSTPMGQGIIGLSYYCSDNLAFGLDYRYLATRNIRRFHGRASTNTLNFSLNYWFADS